MKKIYFLLICLVLISCSSTVNYQTTTLTIDGTSFKFDVKEGFELNDVISSKKYMNNVRRIASDEGYLSFDLFSNEGLRRTTYLRNGIQSSCNVFSQTGLEKNFIDYQKAYDFYAISKDCVDSMDLQDIKCLSFDSEHASELETIILKYRSKFNHGPYPPNSLPLGPEDCSYSSKLNQFLGKWKTLDEASKDGRYFKVVKKKQIENGNVYFLKHIYTQYTSKAISYSTYSIFIDLSSYTKNGFKTVVFTSENKKNLEKVYNSLRISE